MAGHKLKHPTIALTGFAGTPPHKHGRTVFRHLGGIISVHANTIPITGPAVSKNP